MSKQNRNELLRRYHEGPAVLAAAISRLTQTQLDQKPSDGGFSAREVVHHTADSEMTAAIRLGRLVAEDNPQIAGYDPDLFAARLHYASRSVQPSLNAIRAARESTTSILEALSDQEWDRAGTHTERGHTRSIPGSRSMRPTATTMRTRYAGPSRKPARQDRDPGGAGTQKNPGPAARVSETCGLVRPSPRSA